MLIRGRLLGAIQGSSGRRVGVRRGRDGRRLARGVRVLLLDVWVTGEASSRLGRTRGRGGAGGVAVVRGARGVEVWRLLLGGGWLGATGAKVLPLIIAWRTGSRVGAIMVGWELSLWG